VLMVLAFPRVAATAWDSLGQQWSTFQASFAEGDVLDMAVRVLSILAIALPIFGMVYIVARLVRQVTTGVWRSTHGRPGRRAAAVVTALAILAGVAWAWWPEEERYRPIQSYERGTLIDALPMAAPTSLDPGVVARATTAWPTAEPLPTRDDPVLSVVLVPRPAEGAAGTTTTPTAPDAGAVEVVDPGTWVFPFNRPPAPGEGDNQALAVNTEDGSTVYDVAFALVWAEDGSTDNVNSAWALASCTDCTTVAVAFQVVLVLGQSDIAPQNLAAAVNYSCVTCVTGALSQQLVVTLDGPVDAATERALAELWTRVAAYGETLEGRSLTEIRAQLTEFEREILAVLGRGAASGSSSTTQTSMSSSPTPSADPSQSASPTADAFSDPSGTPTATTTTSSPSEPSATPTASSSPSSTPGSTTATESGTDAESEPSPTASPTQDPTRTSSAEPSPSASP